MLEGVRLIVVHRQTARQSLLGELIFASLLQQTACVVECCGQHRHWSGGLVVDGLPLFEGFLGVPLFL